ncbi:hypothetical protein AC578_3441 [Pseudocercospora eumusae]|uniref:Uncharacterized protein n=1 Tax=Pseudocercospora eumusae TaxID=321146 RepID=A0A139HQY6_9PEZI|nr:hypothetical protein AC578_3441 [Pseudocercospora eumusae]
MPEGYTDGSTHKMHMPSKFGRTLSIEVMDYSRQRCASRQIFDEALPVGGTTHSIYEGFSSIQSSSQSTSLRQFSQAYSNTRPVTRPPPYTVAITTAVPTLRPLVVTGATDKQGGPNPPNPSKSTQSPTTNLPSPRQQTKRPHNRRQLQQSLRNFLPSKIFMASLRWSNPKNAKR